MVFFVYFSCLCLFFLFVLSCGPCWKLSISFSTSKSTYLLEQNMLHHIIVFYFYFFFSPFLSCAEPSVWPLMKRSTGKPSQLSYCKHKQCVGVLEWVMARSPPDPLNSCQGFTPGLGGWRFCTSHKSHCVSGSHFSLCYAWFHTKALSWCDTQYGEMTLFAFTPCFVFLCFFLWLGDNQKV